MSWKRGTRTTEREEQALLFQWADMVVYSQPELIMLFAIPCGQMRRGMPMEPGLKAGVPDIFLAVSRKGYHGLFIELKRDPSCKTTKAQDEWLERLSRQGYRAVVCYGFDGAKREVEEYLS